MRDIMARQSADEARRMEVMMKMFQDMKGSAKKEPDPDVN
jgi:transcriptional/translational regulatory protein YebC/TACO1